MRGCADGESLLQDADTMFGLMQDFFELPAEEKKKFDFTESGGYFGYKGMGAEVIDGKGTKDI
jgi:isopenicillin N synthase-like dioxygenase